ncbi:MAG: hypothetical protein AAGG44_13600, partial [Planctomycetota bacterium]
MQTKRIRTVWGVLSVGLMLTIGHNLAWLQAAPLPQGEREQRDADTSDELTLRNIHFYSSGLARFGYEAWVEAAIDLHLVVPTENVSDVLRTISVADSAQGLRSIHVLNELDERDSKDSSAPDLDDSAIDVSSRIDILLSLRGEEIEWTLDSGRIMAGQLLSVEKSLEAFGTSISERVRVSWLSADEVQTALLDEIASFRCVQPAVQKRIQHAIATLNQARPEPQSIHPDATLIEISLAAGPRRKIGISLMQEMPIWKCSYVLDDDNLRMHVVVDNPTDQDWKQVEVSVSDGRPIAFDINLHQSIRLVRQELDLPVGIPGLPPAFEEQIAFPPQNAAATAGGPEGGYGGGGYGGGGYGDGMYGGMGAGMGGMGAGSQSSSGFPSNLSLALSAPQTFAAPWQRLGLDFRNQASKEGDLNGLPLTLKFPTTDVPSHSSTLLASPKLECEVKHSSVYAPEYDSKNPLKTVELVNQSESLLPAGPLTFHAAGSYQGEAMLERTSSQADRLISYALDTTLRVVEGRAEVQRTISEVVFDDDRKSFVITWQYHRTQNFIVRNSSAEDRDVILYLPREGSWELASGNDDESP